ncbi:hypothetical protein NQ318_008893 [Aromia moschata]|uniref:Fe2OG dioxygenase domain-containing protein n=1 Tax=Aromia moschata TaxID=1265417 RepID=A0AAV8ZA53_9CUCU|nr:hypothetical protein NQ318_008893 [Aromia moschata]
MSFRLDYTIPILFKSEILIWLSAVTLGISMCLCLFPIEVDFGHLINPDTYDITRAEPDMYQIFDNEIDWEEKYIHKEYKDNFLPRKEDLQPCPDVYWFPMVSEKFNTALINMMETFGKWSSGTNEDSRLEGGYEAVPTRDIHMNQVGFEKHWLHFLKKYVLPLQQKVFIGYFHDPPRSLMNFVVRYKPDEQPLLRPHHDSSTYTINIALNKVGVDYEGGGCKFLRYNCSVVDTKPGWILMHPGKLTHYHEARAFWVRRTMRLKREFEGDGHGVQNTVEDGRLRACQKSMHSQEGFQSHPTHQDLLTTPQLGKFSGGKVGDGISHLALNRSFTVGLVNFKSLQVMP